MGQRNTNSAMLTAQTTTGVSGAFTVENIYQTFQARGTTTAGSGSATIKIEVCNFDSPATADWITLGTITLTLGTTSTTDGFSKTAAWDKVRANVSAISGTGASVDVIMSSYEPNY